MCYSHTELHYGEKLSRKHFKQLSQIVWIQSNYILGRLHTLKRPMSKIWLTVGLMNLNAITWLIKSHSNHLFFASWSLNHSPFLFTSLKSMLHHLQDVQIKEEKKCGQSCLRMMQKSLQQGRFLDTGDIQLLSIFFILNTGFFLPKGSLFRAAVPCSFLPLSSGPQASQYFFFLVHWLNFLILLVVSHYLILSLFYMEQKNYKPFLSIFKSH